MEPTVFNLWKSRNFFSYSRIKQIFSQRSCDYEALGSECWIQNTASPRRSVSAFGCFLEEPVTSCKLTSEVRKIFSHFSCSCHISKNSPSFSHQVGKWKCVIKHCPLEYSGKNRIAVWGFVLFFLRAKKTGFPILCYTLQNSKKHKKTTVRK